MEIRRGMAADEAASRALWGYCFEQPGDPFFEWYFSRVYRPEETLVGQEGGRTACALHLRPYVLSLRGRAQQADYIVGVATHPAARGRGLARELLAEAFRASRDAGKAVDILMPSDASFYRPMGFAFYAHQWEREAEPVWLNTPAGGAGTPCAEGGCRGRAGGLGPAGRHLPGAHRRPARLYRAE